MHQLTDAQKRVLKWIGHGLRTSLGAGSALMVNGKRVCNLDTMKALQRAGLVSEVQPGCWAATEQGPAVTEQLGL